MDARNRQGLGHRRVLDAARRRARAHRPGGRPGPPVGSDPGDPAPDRAGVAGGHRPAGHGRGADHPRLRRAAGRRRDAYRQHLRRLRGPARRLHPPAAGQGHSRAPAHRGVRGRVGRGGRRRRHARPRLQRGQRGGGGHERGHDFVGPLRGGPGHRRGHAVHPGPSSTTCWSWPSSASPRSSPCRPRCWPPRRPLRPLR